MLTLCSTDASGMPGKATAWFQSVKRLTQRGHNEPVPQCQAVSPRQKNVQVFQQVSLITQVYI